MDIKKRRPSSNHYNDNIEERDIGSWLSTNYDYYKNNTGGMKDKTRYDKFTKFLEKYEVYFINNEEDFKTTLLICDNFIQKNERRPKICIKEEKYLGEWIQRRCSEYNNTKGMKKHTYRIMWEAFITKHKQHFMNVHEEWDNNLKLLINFINNNTNPIHQRKPSKWSKDTDEKNLNNWMFHQLDNYKKNIHNMRLDYECKNTRQKWEGFIEDFKIYFKNVVLEKNLTNSIIEEKQETYPIIILKPKKSMKLKPSSEKKETIEQKRVRVKTEISVLHQRYKTLNSENLNQEFNGNPDLWYKYHEISEENEQSFPENDIPRNRIIQELNKIKTKRTKLVVDMGCGKGQISKYFSNDKRFQFINYDHVSSNDTVISCDISNIPLDEDTVEICILSLAMWGSNCKEYVKEANRILESGGKLYIIEPTKRWSEQDENKNIIEGKEGNKLKTLLEENGFKIVEKSIEKFCLFVCIKM
jgi:ribosomal RNA-processing protein 8